jgi:hypothetical protein
MREIKFRAWDERHKVMHNDFQFIRSGIEGNDWIVFTSDRQTLQTNPHPLENPYFQQQFKIMQFTGLYDSTKWVDATEQQKSYAYEKARVNNTTPESEWLGVEIYEGDIVRGMYGEQLGSKFEEYKFRVVFDRGAFVIENNLRTKNLRDARTDKNRCEIYFVDRGHNNIPDHYLLIKDIQIIGNIHESEVNP